jgi:hypothetical protein
MLDEPSSAFCAGSRRRVVFVRSHGSRRFFGRSHEEGETEVTIEEVEALVSAGFDIVEVNMSDGRPLCAALASPPATWTRTHGRHWLDHPRPARRNA